MEKRIIAHLPPAASHLDDDWLKVEDLVQVELTSEDALHPIESALQPGLDNGWRAAEPGKQTIRFVFTNPQPLRRIQLDFVETAAERTQEYVLRWSPDGGKSFREIVRQQWNFSPQGTTRDAEDYRVNLADVTVLELSITPDISGRPAFASLSQLRLA